MKILLAVLFSATLIWLHGGNSPENLNNSTTKVAAITQPAEQVRQTATAPAPIVKQDQTPAPQAPTPVVEPEISHPKGCENYRHLISQYDWNVTTFLRIAEKESGCNPSAVGDNRVIGGIHAPSCGLFQVRTLRSRPSCEALKDPATNIAWAYRIYQGQGFGAWSVCNVKVKCS